MQSDQFWQASLLDDGDGDNEIRAIADEATTVDAEIAARMQKIKWDLIHRVGDERQFAARVGNIIRAAVDYVIDAPTLLRYTINEIDPDEKTAIGKRIERLLKFEFGLPSGERLDVTLGGEDVDIKTTMRKNWMFSTSSHDHINLLIAYDEDKALFRLGLTYILSDHLGAKNRDEKRSLSKVHQANIYWILKDEPYAPNFLAQQPKSIFDQVVSQKTGSKRVIQLLRLAKGIPIPRHVILSVANQKDPMKRVRSNGGARDVLWSEGVLVLSGQYENDRRVAKTVLSMELATDEMLTFSRHDTVIAPELLSLYQSTHALP